MNFKDEAILNKEMMFKVLYPYNKLEKDSLKESIIYLDNEFKKNEESSHYNELSNYMGINKEYALCRDKMIRKNPKDEVINIRNITDFIKNDKVIKKIGMLRFKTCKTKEEYDKHLAKLKSIDLIKVKAISDDIDACYYRGDIIHTNIDIVAKAKEMYVDNSKILPDGDDREINLFNMIKAEEIVVSDLNFSRIDSLKEEFSANENAQTITFSNIDLSNITDMSGLFTNCITLEHVYFSNVVPPKECKIDGLFTYTNIAITKELDLSFFNNTKIISADSLFGMKLRLDKEALTHGFNISIMITNNINEKRKEAYIRIFKRMKNIVTKNSKIKKAIMNERVLLKKYLKNT